MFVRYRLITAFIVLILACFFSGLAAAQPGINLLPKYGGVPKNAEQIAADEKYIAEAKKYFNGDLKKAASQVALTGWKYLRGGDFDGSMRRFNQAWLLDHSNGSAIWGMAVYQAQTGKMADAFKLFAEAEGLIGEDVDFQADYARLQGFVGAQAGDKERIEDAFNRFRRVYDKLPQHVQNLQNWAITLYYTGDYAQAWEKIKEAELAPRKDVLDQNFISDLQKKMPRP